MKFHCIIVTYNPDIKLFSQVLKSIYSNTSYISIIDNGSSNINDIRELNADVSLISLVENLGVAAAQNM